MSGGWNKLTDRAWLCDTRLVNDVSEQDVAHALEILGLTLPVTSDTLDRAKRVQLYNWNPTRYSNLTNNPTQYMQAYKKAEEMTKLVEASHALLSALLVPDEPKPLIVILQTSPLSSTVSRHASIVEKDVTPSD